MVTDEIKRITELEQQLRTEAEEAAAADKQRLTVAQKQGQELLAQAKLQAQQRSRQLLHQAEQEAGARQEELRQQTRADCEALREQARSRMEQAAAEIVRRVVER